MIHIWGKTRIQRFNRESARLPVQNAPAMFESRKSNRACAFCRCANLRLGRKSSFGRHRCPASVGDKQENWTGPKFYHCWRWESWNIDVKSIRCFFWLNHRWWARGGSESGTFNWANPKYTKCQCVYDSRQPPTILDKDHALIQKQKSVGVCSLTQLVKVVFVLVMAKWWHVE